MEIKDTRRQLLEKLEARTLERNAAREGCLTYLEQRNTAIKMLKSITITGPDKDGLVFVTLKGAMSFGMTLDAKDGAGMAALEFRSRLEWVLREAQTH